MESRNLVIVNVCILQNKMMCYNAIFLTFRLYLISLSCIIILVLVMQQNVHCGMAQAKLTWIT